jgi:DNA repair protein
MSSSTTAHAPPNAPAAAASSSAPQRSSHVPDFPDEDEDIDQLVELEQSLLAESQQADEDAATAAAAAATGGGGGFDPEEEGGGFFTAEQAAAGGAEGDSAQVASLEEDAPARPFASGCRECGNVGVQQNFLTAFNVSVCYRCQRAHPARYALVTQTSCVHTYLLPVALVQSRLGYLEKKNPHKQAWGVMKLYWKQQVLSLVREKYGSLEALESARHARDVARIAKDDAKRRAAHQAAAREAAFESTLAASMGELYAQTPSEVVAMLAQRTKGLGSAPSTAAAAAAKRADKRRRGRKAAAAAPASPEVEDLTEEGDAAEDGGAANDAAEVHAPRKKAKKSGDSAARAPQSKQPQLHVHSFRDEAGKRVCSQCGFTEEFEEF